MTRRAHRSAHGRPLPDGPAPFTTLVELTFEKRKVEHWIRFGRKTYEQIIDRRRSVVGFAPSSVFAFVRWAKGEHGTVVSRIDIVRAIGRGEPFRHCPSSAPVAKSCCASIAGPRCSAGLPPSTPWNRSASIRPTPHRSIGGTSTTV